MKANSNSSDKQFYIRCKIYELKYFLFDAIYLFRILKGLSILYYQTGIDILKRQSAELER